MQPDAEPTRNPWLKSMALGVVLGAAILGIAGLILERAFSPDPDSETFTVLGQPHTPAWTPANKAKHHGGVNSWPSRIFRDTDFEVWAIDDEYRQPLFTWSYNNHFGKQTYAVACELQTNKSPDWQDYPIQLHVTGGGNVGASADVRFEFNDKTKTLTAHLHQQFRSKKQAKATTLVFQWDGEQFVLAKE